VKGDMIAQACRIITHQSDALLEKDSFDERADVVTPVVPRILVSSEFATQVRCTKGR
jgi:hypothetical protein